MSIELAAYWEERAVRYGHVEGGLPAVCSYGMPRLYNEAIDVCQRRALEPLLRQWRALDILDAGCGIGRWSLELARRGNRVVGVDISATMVSLARKNSAAAQVDCEFAVGSIVSHRLDRRFDVVLAVTVLLLEVAPTRFTSLCDSDTFLARPLASYRAALRGAGLEIASVRGVDAQVLRKLSVSVMRTLPASLARAVVSAAAPLALPADLVVGRLFPNACWHKVILAKPVE
jgi:SAM-dependent methyltransferase